MLWVIEKYEQLDGRKLMDLYREGNEQNVAHFMPEVDPAVGQQRIEQEFLQYLREAFFAKRGNCYYILEENGVWVSALRLYQVEDFYYLEALETLPLYRRKGYAKQLLQAVFNFLGQKGNFVVRDAVKKTNTASLQTHQSCGFEIERQDAFVYTTGETDSGCYGMIYRGGFEDNVSK